MTAVVANLEDLEATDAKFDTFITIKVSMQAIVHNIVNSVVHCDAQFKIQARLSVRLIAQHFKKINKKRGRGGGGGGSKGKLYQFPSFYLILKCVRYSLVSVCLTFELLRVAVEDIKYQDYSLPERVMCKDWKYSRD